MKKKVVLAAKLVKLGVFSSSCIALQYIAFAGLTTLEINHMAKELSKSSITKAYYADGATSPKGGKESLSINRGNKKNV